MLSDDFFLIVNANASKGKARQKFDFISQFFKSNGHNAPIGITQGPGHAVLLAKKAIDNGFSTIIAVGGDGTVNEVVNGIMQSKKSSKINMGIIPVGRGNDFAWCANIPKNLNKASELILNNKAKKTDVGFVRSQDNPEGRYFINGAGFGFEPLVNFRAMEYKHLNGMPSYIVSFFYYLKNVPISYNLKISLDGNEEMCFSSQQLSVANGIRMGSAFKMTPRAIIDDGMFDVMFTKNPLKGKELIKLVIKFLSGKHVTDKENFGYYNAKKVKIEADMANVPTHTDGEIFTKCGKDFDLEVIPGALNLIRP